MIRSSELVDVWTLKKTGEYYYLGTLFEDKRDTKKLFIDTRIVRITEAFLRTAGLYRRLGLDDSEIIDIKLRHIGLRDRSLSVISPRRMPILDKHVCEADEASSSFSEPIKNLVSLPSLKRMVFKAVNEITQMFDLYEVKADIVDPTVEAFEQGRVL